MKYLVLYILLFSTCLSYAQIKRFTSKDELKQVSKNLTFYDGEVIKIGTLEYEVKFSYKNYHRNLSDSAVKDRIVDGFFVDTIPTGQSKNLVYYSENIINISFYSPDGLLTPYIFLNGNAGKIAQNCTDAPDGSMTAERLSGFNTTASNQLQIFGHKKTLQAGDTVTMAFFARLKKSKGIRHRITSAGISGTTLNDFVFVVDGKWHPYKQTVVLKTVNSPTSLFFGVFNGFAYSDTLDVWGFDIREGAGGEYHQTNWDNRPGVLYLYRKDLINGKTLDLSFARKGDYNITSGRQNDSPLIQAAMDYCGEGERCNEVLLPIDVYNCTDPLIMRRGVVLSGVNPAARQYNSFQPPENVLTVIRFALKDKTDYAIHLERYGKLDVLDNSGLKNLYIQAVDTLAGYVKTNEIANCGFSYITAVTSNGGHVDSICWNMQVSESSDNHYNNFRHVYIGGNKTTPYGLVYGGGVGNTFQNCAFSANTSILVKYGEFDAEVLSIETGNTGIETRGGDAYIGKFYSEDSAYNKGSTVKMNGGSLYFYNSTFQTATKKDTLFNIISGKTFSVSDSKIRIQGVTKISDNIDVVEFKNVGSVTELRPYLNIESSKIKSIDISGNYDVFDNDAALYSDYKKGVVPQSGVISGNENILNDGSFIPSKTAYSYKVFADYSEREQGSKTADLITVTRSAPSEWVQDKTLNQRYKIGTPYTVSAWLKGVSSDNIKTVVTARLGVGGASVNFIVNSNEWKYYEKVIYATVADNTLTIRLGSVTAGDIFLIDNIQVTENTNN